MQSPGSAPGGVRLCPPVSRPRFLQCGPVAAWCQNWAPALVLAWFQPWSFPRTGATSVLLSAGKAGRSPPAIPIPCGATHISSWRGVSYSPASLTWPSTSQNTLAHFELV